MDVQINVRCPICLDYVKTSSASSTLCGHVFCTGCIVRALATQQMCPVCRHPLSGPLAHHQLFFNIRPAAERRAENNDNNERVANNSNKIGRI